VYDTVLQQSVSTEKTFVRNILGAFLFSGDTVDKPVKVLSGGEKARLVLATILSNPGNVLLLDEPTNHLDIRSIEMLSEAMGMFGGTILFVSHDEFFISKVANRIVEVRPGRVRDFPGTLADYRVYVETLFSNETENEKKIAESNQSGREQPSGKVQRIKDRESRKKLTRTVEKIERDIASCEENIEKLKIALNDSSNAFNHELLHKTSQELESQELMLLQLMTDWEERQIELSESE
jgi:ATP-binding cassette subfamily F protein 3